MESCDVDQSDGLSSDIGGFLSSSCMETDEKSDPFNTDNGLGFPEDSSRFDSECILSSSLAESVTMQQTTTCDSSVPSFVSGDSFSTCSMLSGGSLLLYDIPGSSMQKPTNPVMQLNSSNVMLVGGTESKAQAVDQKFDFLSPVQLLTPSVSHTQSQPVVIGNPSAASFVKSVLKDAAVLPSTSSSTFLPAKETVSVPPVMLLNSAFPIPLSMLQPAQGITSAPLLIQLPAGVGISRTPDPQQPVYSMNNLMSTEATTSVLAPVSAMNSVSMDSLTSSDCGAMLTSSCASVPSSSMLPVSGHVSSSLLTAISTPVDCLPASSGSLHNATYTTTRTESDSINNNILDHSNNSDDNNNSNNSNYNNNKSNNINNNTMETVSSINICDSFNSTPQMTHSQTPKPPAHPIVISCLRPNSKGSKGMQQILEHFLQQNKANSSQTAANTDNKQTVNFPLQLTNMVDIGSAGASTSSSGDVKPQVISAADLDGGGSSSSFTVPSLGTKSGSVVFILRRAGSQTNAQCSNSMSSNLTPVSSVCDKTTAAALSMSCSDAKEDEVDGSVTSTVDSSVLMSDVKSEANSVASSSANIALDNTASSNYTVLDNAVPSDSPVLDNRMLNSTTSSDSTLPKVALPEQYALTEQTGLATTVMNSVGSGESTGTLSTLTSPTFPMSNSNTDATNVQYQWIQIQLPNNTSVAGERQDAESEGTTTTSEDLQKLIPSTVKEKLASDLCHPIIICIVQEDGLMKKVNINTGENGDVEMKDVTVTHTAKQEDGNCNLTVTASTTPDSSKSTLALSSIKTDTTSINSATITPEISPPHSHPLASTSDSSPSQDSSSPQTGSENGSSPARSKKSPISSKEKQYGCDLCTAVFSRLGNFTRHRKIHTLNLKEDKHFKCPYCERPFLQRCDMNRHIAVHTNQYPFRCQTCDKGYIRKSDLIVHERFHTKNRAFKCETCGRAFYQSGDLKRHKRFVHMEQSQLSCGHCQRKYASEVTLIRHMKTAHNDILLQSMSQQQTQQQ